MATSPVVVTESSLKDLREKARREPGTLFAVLDACDEPRIPETAQLLGPQKALSLYRGSAEEDFWALAPYLAQVDETLLDWLAGALWGTPWGIFAVARVDLETLRRHFRRFLRVRGPEGEPWYFRFYDPRVLPGFLASCSDGEAQQLFGPVESFVLHAKGDSLLSIERSPARSQTSASPVVQAGSLVAVSATNPLRIRQEHLKAMEPAVLDHFEQRAVDHLKGFFPKHMELLGPEQARKLVRYGVERSARRGITADRDVLLWITLMVLLGSDFDADPQYPWVEKRLSAPGLSETSDRMDALFDKATVFLDRVMGRENEHLCAALARLDAVSLPDLAASFSDDFRHRADDWLRGLWPEKAKLLRPETMRQLLKHVVGLSQEWRMASAEGCTLLGGLAFFLGSGVDHDPQFPWVAAVLNEPGIGRDRAARLWEAARAYGRQWSP